MNEIHDFLDHCVASGLRFRIKGEALLVSPKEKLLPADAAFIREHKAALMAEVARMPPTCPGTCPGPLHELCAGCPKYEYLLADGRIVADWCLTDRVMMGAVQRREFGGEWEPINSSSG